MLNDSMSEILGMCNYTKIGKGECWLGYSISSKYEEMGIMYEAVVNRKIEQLEIYNLIKSDR